MKFNCPNCNRWYDLPTEPGNHACDTCGRVYYISRTSTPPAVTHPCPNCEQAARAVPVICGCGDHIGYAEVIGLSQDGAVCGNCATSRKDYDARTELATLRVRLAATVKRYDARHFWSLPDRAQSFTDLYNELQELLKETEAK